MRLNYETTETGPLQAGANSIGNLLQRNGVAALNDLGDGALARVRQGLPRHGGDSLYNSIKLERATLSKGPTFDLRTDSPIAIFREVDTKAHIILPVNKKALAFTVGRTQVFATKVNHPGTRGLHNWQYANQQVRLRLPYAIQAAVDAALNMQPYAKRYS